MNLKTKITLAFILTIFLSCSSETDEDTSPIDSEIVTIAPNFGYEGDEITFEMSNPIPSNANVSITYNGQSAIVNEINGKTIKHIVPDNPESSTRLTINGQETYINGSSSSGLLPLKKYIDCENCREKALVHNADNISNESIVSTFKKNNSIYLVKLSKDNDANDVTLLIKTDLNFKIISQTKLFNNFPSSNIIVEDNSFIIQNNGKLLSYDLNGNIIWSYTSSKIVVNTAVIGTLRNSIVKFNSNYYVLNSIGYVDVSETIEVLKLSTNGQLISTINIPMANNINHSVSHAAISISVLNNKIVIFRKINIIYNSTSQNVEGYIVIDNNDNIIKNSFTDIDFSSLYSINFIEDNSIYHNKRLNGNTVLQKISLDNNNNLNLDWIKEIAGIIAKHNNKYLIFQGDKVLIYNDNNFNNPVSFETFLQQSSINLGANTYNNEIYIYGTRTIFNANDYHALIGKYDLNYIDN